MYGSAPNALQHCAHVEKANFSSMTRERELQVTLVRLSVLCASSVQAVYGDHVAEAVTDAEQDGVSLAEKLHGDASAILGAVRKDATALSLAMRPEKGKEVSDDCPPSACIDAGSMESAIALLQRLATDYVPKLVYLANLAHKNRAVYRTVPGDEADEAAAQIGTVLNQKHGTYVSSASVGVLFSSDLKQAIAQVVDLVAQLCQSFMDPRTRMALDTASRRRGDEMANAPPPSRAYSLSLTKQLWSLCDELVGTPDARAPLATRLTRNNQEAYAKICKGNEAVLADASLELKGALEDDETGDEDDEWDGGIQLSNEEKELVRRTMALMEAGAALQTAVRSALLQRGVQADFDAAGAELASLVEAQDNVCSLALYGDDNSDDELEKVLDEYGAICKRIADASGKYRTSAVDGAMEAVSQAISHVHGIL